MSGPDVSCVITPGPGGAAALRASVESVLGQSLRAVEALVVLDPDAAAPLRAAAGALAGRSPERVRVLTADSPGGFAAVPRNAGLSAARGTYVLVLGDGERLQRHACRTLWETGERTRADLVAGGWSRLTGDGTKEAEPPWQHALFPRSRVVTRLTDAPELVVRDALVTGFCLRREALERHGLRYDEDLGPSETAFGPRAASAVGRIALVRRRIVDGRAPADPGRDLAGRVEAHRRVCHLLEARGLTDLREERERAFLLDRLVALVRAFPALPTAERDRLAATAARVLAGNVPEPVLLTLPPVERVGVRLLERGDADGVLEAAYALRRRGTVAAPLVRGRDGRVHWRGDGADPALDVTELGHQHRTFGELRLMNRLTRYEADGGRVLLEGRIVLPDHTGPGPAPTAHLEFRVRDGSRTFRFPVDELRRDATGISWRTRADLTRLLRPLGARDTLWDARMTVEDETGSSVGALFAAHDLVGPKDRSPARPRLGRAAGDTWQPYITLKDHLALRLEAHRRPARTVRRLAHYATHFRP
ncbi:glycosyltransferase, partial [Streptomyces sp. NRRL WC-3549]|uniref:glycosyltransferase n=1 Tax=Streptomyces sp. NRRL WC-3549 TaxID=1463925 RepID=UPI0004C92C12